MEGSSGHEANDSRAIGISDERPLPRPDLHMRHGLRIHLRDDQRHRRVHPEGGAVIHHHGPALDGDGPELLAHRTAGAEQGEVDAGEALGGELLDGVVPALEVEAAAGGAEAGQHLDGAVGEAPVGEHPEELLADGARDADDGDGGAGVRPRRLEGEGAGWPGCGGLTGWEEGALTAAGDCGGRHGGGSGCGGHFGK